jgi:bifunctional oligoribonuclease and PAP phosphatase NrnA
MNAMEALCAAIRDSSGIMLTTHCNPDGDGIGSQLALYHALRSGGFPVAMHNHDPVPRIYRFLEGSEQVGCGKDPRTENIDLVISLDAGSRARLGFDDSVFAGRKLAVIDHHASNTRFGDINLVDVSSCSTGAIVYELIRYMKLSLSPASATAIFVTVLTDTSSFRNAATTPEVHELAAELIRAGAESWPIARAIYEDRSVACFKLQVCCMQTLVLRHQERSAWLHVDARMYRDTGSDSEDTEGLIEFVRALSGVKIAVFMRPGDDASSWKVTFRAKYDIDVGSLAESLGGGGHRHAAGCTMRGDFDAIQKQVEQAVAAVLE